MTEDPWKLHIAYLEEEVRKLEERADRLEAMIEGLESAQKKLTARELVKQLRDQASEHRKYLALVKPH